MAGDDCLSPEKWFLFLVLLWLTRFRLLNPMLSILKRRHRGAALTSDIPAKYNIPRVPAMVICAQTHRKLCSANARHPIFAQVFWLCLRLTPAIALMIVLPVDRNY